MAAVRLVSAISHGKSPQRRLNRQTHADTQINPLSFPLAELLAELISY